MAALFFLTGSLVAQTTRQSQVDWKKYAKPNFGNYFLVSRLVLPGVWRFTLSKEAPASLILPNDGNSEIIRANPPNTLMLTSPSEWMSYGQDLNIEVQFGERARPSLDIVQNFNPPDTPKNLPKGQSKESPPPTDSPKPNIVFTISPYSPDGLLAGILINDHQRYQQVVGLGADLNAFGNNLSLISKVVQVGGPYGNKVVDLAQGRTAGLQAPIIFALGEGRECAAFFFNETRPLAWDFTSEPWSVSLVGPLDPLNSLDFFVIVGEDLPAVRRTYMSLVGRPPVPPKKMFSPWVVVNLEDEEIPEAPNWGDYFKLLKDELKPFHIPGALILGAPVLNWALEGANPVFNTSQELRKKSTDSPIITPLDLAKAVELDLILAETPYVPIDLPIFAEMSQVENNFVLDRGDDQSFDDDKILTLIYEGQESGLLDYTNNALSSFWHNAYRQKVIQKGFTSFFLKGGEPEIYSPVAWYKGAYEHDEHSHYVWANRFSLKWMEGIKTAIDETPSVGPNSYKPRLFLLTRSGLAGQGRYGASFYYVDPNLLIPLSEGLARGNLSLSGIDYFAPDVSPMTRQFDLSLHNQAYSAWLARNALISLPLLIPHDFLKEPWVADNLAIRERFFPYMYSLAHQAYLSGEPMVAPLLYHFPEDLMARDNAANAMLGSRVMVAAGVYSGAEVCYFYLPAGRWFDLYGNRDINQAVGRYMSLPCKNNGVPVAPILLRSGAIVPTRPKDPDKILAHVIVFPGEESSSFELHDDNGFSLDYAEDKKRVEFSDEDGLQEEGSEEDDPQEEPSDEATFLEESSNIAAPQFTGKKTIRLELTPTPASPGQSQKLTFTIHRQEGRLPNDTQKGFLLEFVGLRDIGQATFNKESFIRVNKEDELPGDKPGWVYAERGRLQFNTGPLDMTKEKHVLVLE
ncbi:MAG: hypothetical protein LBR11_02495 [Deltaproteobacteria bacterium]|nr:hypothetical protein [Deltaproteobacteria bacterium]